MVLGRGMTSYVFRKDKIGDSQEAIVRDDEDMK